MQQPFALCIPGKYEDEADQKINNVVMVTGQPDLVAASLRDKVLVW